jgi:hypothetical protein
MYPINEGMANTYKKEATIYGSHNARKVTLFPGPVYCSGSNHTGWNLGTVRLYNDIVTIIG